MDALNIAGGFHPEQSAEILLPSSVYTVYQIEKYSMPLIPANDPLGILGALNREPKKG
jgi:hypothetical protein